MNIFPAAEAAREFLESTHRAGKKIVFTNGCFDILHAGHIDYLTRAKALGDLLIVGLNTDQSVQKNKGPLRPLNSEQDRATVLTALRAVDAVILFSEQTPTALIEVVRPAVHVKGGDYVAEKLPEFATVTRLGGKVEILPFLPGRSTTNVIEKILKSYGKN